MFQPDALKQDKPWLWSPGKGTDVWAMFVACSSGDLDKVRELIETDPSLVRSHYEYRTPLSFAVRENQLEIAEFLLDRGATNVGFGDAAGIARERGHGDMERLIEKKFAERYGASSKGESVAKAIREYDASKMRDLLDASPDLLNAGDRAGNRPIHWAAMTRQLDLIDELLDRGAGIDARRIDGARPIHLTNGDYSYRGWRDVPAHVTTKPDEVYHRLVSRGAFVDVWMAAVNGDVNRVRELIDADPSLVNRTNDYNSYYAGCGSPLQNAAGAGHLDIVKLLLDRGADPNLPDETIAPLGRALYAAVYNGHYEIAKLLLEHGANPDGPVESSADAVWIAIRSGDRRTLELLASHGATWQIPIELNGALTYDDIAATGIRRSIRVLASFGDVATAAPLFEADASLADDPDALTAAANNAHEEFVQLMLRFSPDLAKRVLVSKPREIAELLFDRGMNPDRPTWMGRTPLHHFAEKGDIESAKLFLDHGANLDTLDDDERLTPLGVARKYGKTEMAEFLMQHGATR